MSNYAFSEPDAQESLHILMGYFIAEIPTEMEENHRPLILNLSSTYM